MKRFLPASLVVAALLGCDAEDRKTAATNASTALATSSASGAAPSAPPTATNAPVPVPQLPLPKPPPELPEPVRDVVRIAQTTIGETAMLGFVESLQEPISLTADQVIYLGDLGVPTSVIQALLKKGQPQPGLAAASDAPTAPVATAIAPATITPAPVATPAQAASLAIADAPLAEAAPVAPAAPIVANGPVAEGTTAVAGQPVQQVNYNYFYDSLSPYGNWVEVDNYGWCWQPTVAVIDSGWRPYGDQGSWLWTESGWYWNSNNSWGWAPFHYGNWCRSPGYGWVWSPGYTWSPAWVSWSRHNDYCGWAPLPPGCGWSSGVGLTWYGSGVSWGFGFNLGYSDYCYVPWKNVCHANPRSYCLPAHRASAVHAEGTVVNNYINGNNNTIVNNGIGHQTAQQLSRSEIRKVRLDDAQGPNIQPVKNPLERRDPSLAVYRPQVSTQAAQPSAQVLARQESRKAVASGGSPTVISGRPAGGGAATTFTRSEPVRMPATGLTVPSARPSVMGRPSMNTSGTVSRPDTSKRLESRPANGSDPLFAQPAAAYSTPANQASPTVISRPPVRGNPTQGGPSIQPVRPPLQTPPVGTRGQPQRAELRKPEAVGQPVPGSGNNARPPVTAPAGPSIRQTPNIQSVRPTGVDSVRPPTVIRSEPSARNYNNAPPARSYSAPARPGPGYSSPAPAARPSGPAVRQSAPGYSAPVRQSAPSYSSRPSNAGGSRPSSAGNPGRAER